MAPNPYEKFLADRNIHSKPKSTSKLQLVSKSELKFIYNPNKPSPLLALPPELRNKIYTSVFGLSHIFLALKVTRLDPFLIAPQARIDPSTSYTHNQLKQGYENAWGRSSSTFALLKTCRRVHAETKMLVWHLNTFDLKTPNCLEIWVRQLSVPMQALRVLRVYCVNAEESRATFQVGKLAGLVGLRRVEVVVEVAVWEEYGRRRAVREKEVERVFGEVKENERVLRERIVGVLGRGVGVVFLKKG